MCEIVKTKAENATSPAPRLHLPNLAARCRRSPTKALPAWTKAPDKGRPTKCPVDRGPPLRL